LGAARDLSTLYRSVVTKRESQRYSAYVGKKVSGESGKNESQGKITKLYFKHMRMRKTSIEDKEDFYYCQLKKTSQEESDEDI
jgi:hypothetical protein